MTGLDPSLSGITNPGLFKKKMFKTIRPIGNKTFNISDKYGLKLLTCLRVEHSDLRAHRFPKNFNCVDPICTCGLENETVEHFFLRCPLFNAPRATLLETIHNIHDYANTNSMDMTILFLYGDTTLSDAENKLLIEAVIKYITKTKRFKTLEAFYNRNEPD